MEIVKIPVSRIKSLLGEKGGSKRFLEKRCNVRLAVDEEGEVRIEGEPMDEFFARGAVKAIGRGFGLNEAMKLLAENYELTVIDLRDFANSSKAAKRLKARVIGEKGKIKKEIEHATGSVVSVYGHTISIISRLDTLEYAQTAIMKLLEGSMHSSVIHYLGNVRRKILSERLRNRRAQ